MNALLKPLDNRLFRPAAAIGGLLILAFVPYLQYTRGFAPCSLYTFVRLGVFGLMLTGIIGSLAPRSRITDGIAALDMLAASLGGIYHAWSLVAKEKLAAQDMGSCKIFMGFPEWVPLDTWLPQVFQPEGPYSKVVWTLLGQSMTVWLLALFVFCLLALATKLAFGRRTT